MKKKVLSILSLSVFFWMNAQEKDSLNQNKIEEVVVTGQYRQQSINKSIYKVEVIDAQEIKNMAVTNAAEVLNQNLNILVQPNSGTGDSNANILGLSGQYTKILIDNIPVVSDQGMGNLVDLTKINVNNIERIEIVKGSMGVEYGNNAVAGVINIITKKNYAKKFNAQISLQEETVGKNYDWFKKGNGRHVQSLNLGYRINDHWTVTADINHNDFQGFTGKYNGYKYFSEGNDGNRGYEWLPKDLLITNAAVRYAKGKTSLFYKVNYLNEEINSYNQLITPDYSSGDKTFIAKDRDYFTNRWLHQFNIQTQLGRINYTGDFSYQTQERKYQDYDYDVPNRQIMSRDPELTFYESKVLYSRGMFSNFMDSEKINFQLGYELDRTDGYANSVTFESNNNGKSIERTIFNYANFLSAEWNVNKWLSLRPGVRLALSDRFDSQYNYSVTAKFNTSAKSDLRAVFGSANRFPTYGELYTFVVDNNHDIRGNENLKPETGYSAGLFWDYNTISSGAWNFNLSLSGMYLDVNDRIESVIVNQQPLKYTFLNVDDYKSILFGGGLNVRKNNFALNTGVSVMGISQALNTGQITSSDDYNFYLEANLGANYTLNTTKTLFALYYKYTGKRNQYTHIPSASPSTDPGQFVLGEVQPFSMMNFTVTQPFFNDHFEVSVGVKNIFDVSTIRNTALPGGGHNAASGDQNLFYGRSYFARVNYNF